MDNKQWGICPVCGHYDMKVMDVQAALLASFPIKTANIVSNCHFKWFRPWDADGEDPTGFGFGGEYRLMALISCKVNGDYIQVPLQIDPYHAQRLCADEVEHLAQFLSSELCHLIFKFVGEQVKEELMDRLGEMVEVKKWHEERNPVRDALEAIQYIDYAGGKKEYDARVRKMKRVRRAAKRDETMPKAGKGEADGRG